MLIRIVSTLMAKRSYIAFLCIGIAVAVSLALFNITDAEANSARVVSPHLVISQFQAGGGTAEDEFVEIFNRGDEPVDLNGHRLVYRSATGSNDVGPFAEWTTSTILQPGQYYLIASTSYDGGVTPDRTYNPASASMGAAGGGLAIRQGASNSGAIIDSVGWGTATNIFVEGTRTGAPGNNNSQSRKENGCQDTDDNSDDFFNQVPAAARNSVTIPAPCGSSGSTLFAAFSANPSTVTPGGNTLLTVTVIPATKPPSTNITVFGDLSNIGGSASQIFFDDGTNGDVTAGDNVYSYSATIPGGMSGGQRNISTQTSDAEGRVIDLSLMLTINAPLEDDDPLLLGNPSNAVADVNQPNNYLMQKPQYSLSYSRDNGTPNWVAWRLDSTWLGSSGRQDDYRPDTTLPVGWYQVTSSDYSGSGFTRGHMCPSGDRTRSVPDNSATFLMTNFVPQLADNNAGPWENFESYCRTLANQGNEIYIYSGGYGTLGTIAGGRVNVPEYTWKVVLIMPNGDNDLQRVTKSTRAFGVIVPNFPPVNPSAPWRNFRVSVDTVEHLTGFNFFSNVPIGTQTIIERRRDIY